MRRKISIFKNSGKRFQLGFDTAFFIFQICMGKFAASENLSQLLKNLLPNLTYHYSKNVRMKSSFI